MTTPARAPLVAVKLTPVGRAHTYLLDDAQPSPRFGESVVVQTDNGTALGTVVRNIPQLEPKRMPAADGSPRVVRIATRDDIIARMKHKHREQEAHRIAVLQIGVRDEAKMYGGYGTCGRPLCCTTFLQTFEPVSIKMAKQQDLSLNPSKLSGLCGRLKCCLRYELPNAKGVQHGGCGSEGGCDNPSGCGTGGCGSCACHH
jgi:cell fate regulator YaaT (PSP1 superfamily)